VTARWPGNFLSARAFIRRRVRSLRTFCTRHSHAGLWLAWYRLSTRCRVPADRVRAMPRSPLALALAFIAGLLTVLIVLVPPGHGGCRQVRVLTPAGPRLACAPAVPGYPGGRGGRP
jgi:hypothetical protein